jgi:hypothetical protein
MINKQCNASLDCLTMMIQSPNRIFEVPNEALVKYKAKSNDQQHQMLTNLYKTHNYTLLHEFFHQKYDELHKVSKFYNCLTRF